MSCEDYLQYLWRAAVSQHTSYWFHVIHTYIPVLCFMEAKLSELVWGHGKIWPVQKPWPNPRPSAAPFPSGPSGCIRSVDWQRDPPSAHRTSRTGDWILARTPASVRHDRRSRLNDTNITFNLRQESRYGSTQQKTQETWATDRRTSGRADSRRCRRNPQTLAEKLCSTAAPRWCISQHNSPETVSPSVPLSRAHLCVEDHRNKHRFNPINNYHI